MHGTSNHILYVGYQPTTLNDHNLNAHKHVSAVQLCSKQFKISYSIRPEWRKQLTDVSSRQTTR